MERKFFIVANPYSGLGKAQQALIQLKKRLDQEGYFYAVFITPKSENLHEFIRENLLTDSTDVVAIGGDGTINATLNAMYDQQMILSIIPTGTGNDFIKTVNIGKNLKEYINTVIYGRERIIDIGDCNGRKFINGVGIGFDGQIIHDYMHRKSLLRGHAKFYSHVLRILGSYQSRNFSFEIDGQKVHEGLITMAIQNGTTFGGGFKLNPDSKIDDGFLNICTIGRIPVIKRFLNISKLNFGKHGSVSGVRFYMSEHIKVKKCDKVLHAHIDGEYLGQPPFEIRVLEKAIKIRVKK